MYDSSLAWIRHPSGRPSSLNPPRIRKTKIDLDTLVGVGHNIFLYGQTDSLPDYCHLRGFVRLADSKPDPVQETKYSKGNLKGQNLSNRQIKSQRYGYKMILTHF